MLTNRQKGILVAGLALILLATAPHFLLGLVRHTSSERDTCLSCHYKIQGQDFWPQSSKHRPSIGCSQCHAPSHGIVNTEFSKYKDLVSFNCVQCHWNAMIGNEKRRVKVSMQEGLKVYEWNLNDMYKWHPGKKTATCTDCHYNIAHDTEAEKTYAPTIESCAACHYHAKKDDYVRVEPLPKLVFVGKE